MELWVSYKGELKRVQIDMRDYHLLGGRPVHIRGGRYACIRVDGVQTYLHRWIMGCSKGDGKIVDHINRDELDNRRANLRFVTARQSVQNRDFGWGKGYIRDGDKYRVRVARNGVTFDLGRWDSEEEARAVRKWFMSGDLNRGRAGRIYTSDFRAWLARECP